MKIKKMRNKIFFLVILLTLVFFGDRDTFFGLAETANADVDVPGYGPCSAEYPAFDGGSANPVCFCTDTSCPSGKVCCDSRTLCATPDCSDANSHCAGERYTSSNGCGNCTGTKTDGNCCADISWAPDPSTSCNSFTQTSNCNRTRQANGTKTPQCPIWACVFSFNDQVCGSDGCGGTCYGKIPRINTCSPVCNNNADYCVGTPYPSGCPDRPCNGTKKPAYTQSDCQKYNITCGTYSDPNQCGPDINCGGCVAPATCVNGSCVGHGGGGDICTPIIGTWDTCTNYSGNPVTCGGGEQRRQDTKADCSVVQTTRACNEQPCGSHGGSGDAGCGGVCSSNSDCQTGLTCDPTFKRCTGSSCGGPGPGPVCGGQTPTCTIINQNGWQTDTCSGGQYCDGCNCQGQCGCGSMPELYCSTQTYNGLCGETCYGTKNCVPACVPTSPNCDVNTCEGSTCNDGCHTLSGKKPKECLVITCNAGDCGMKTGSGTCGAVCPSKDCGPCNSGNWQEVAP